MWLKIQIIRFLTVGLLLAGLSSCTLKSDRSAQGAQGTLKEYISLSFQSKGGAGDRERLLTLLTGPAKTRLAAWSEEQFNQAFVQNKREFLKLTLLENKKVSPTEENITYELTYLDFGRVAGGQGVQVTNRKLCNLVNEKGQWLITEMRNIKELVEYKNEMTFPY